LAWNFEHFSVPTIIFTINFYFSKFLLVFTFSCFLFSRTFLLSLSLSSLIGLSCFRKVKWKMQFFVFLEICKQKFKVTEFEFPTLKLLLLPKNYLPPFHACLCFQKVISLLFTLSPSFLLFVYNFKALSPSFQLFVYVFKNLFPLLLFWFCSRKWRLLEEVT
jgi:hypothetical protein